MEKEINQEKVKVAAAINKGREDLARIYAENAIRKTSEIQYMTKLSSNMENVAAHVKSAMTSNKVGCLQAGSFIIL